MDHSNPSTIDLVELFADYNHTELYQLCRRKGLGVRPAMNRVQLIDLLTDGGEIEEVNNPIDELRDALIAFILQHWRTLRPQLKCPAKDLKNPDPSKENPRPCYGCSDMQVVTCVSTQRTQNLERIVQLRKKKNS